MFSLAALLILSTRYSLYATAVGFTVAFITGSTILGVGLGIMSFFLFIAARLAFALLTVKTLEAIDEPHPPVYIDTRNR